MAIYYFGDKSGANWKRLLDGTSSGAIVANDVMFQALAVDNGFGGVGESGNGRYGGKIGFNSFSNPKSVVERYQMNFYPNTYMNPPWDQAK